MASKPRQPRKPRPGMFPRPEDKCLAARDLLRAVRACHANAQDLLAEAQILLAHGRIARAEALAATGLQELGKARVCIGLLEGDPAFKLYEDKDKFWGLWTHHDGKGMHGLLKFEGASGPFSVLGSTARAATVGQKLETLRQLCLYVDFLQHPEPGAGPKLLRPGEIVLVKHAEDLVEHFRFQLDAMTAKAASHPEWAARP